MPIISEFKFSTPVTGQDAVGYAKAQLVQSLNDQLKAVNSMLEGQSIDLSPRKRWFGQRDATGQALFCVKVKNKPIEFEKGKPFIIVGDEKNLPKVIEKILKATQAGELDAMIDARVKEAKKNAPARK